MVSKVLSADMFGRAGEVLSEHLGDIATVSLGAPCGDVSHISLELLRAMKAEAGTKPKRNDAR